MIFTDFAKALGQILDRRFWRVMIVGILLGIALLVAGYAGILWLIQWIDPSQIALPFVGKITWLTDLLGWASLAFVAVLSIFLMVPVASAITALFLDDVAQAVEDKHYSYLPVAGRVSFYDGLKETVNFLGLLIGANVLALILAGFMPLAYPFIFYLLNGFLLGREYFMIAALRRETPQRARALRAAHAGQIWLAGCLMAIPLTIPVLNLIIPVLGAATFTHLYHRLAGTSR